MFGYKIGVKEMQNIISVLAGGLLVFLGYFLQNLLQVRRERQLSLLEARKTLYAQLSREMFLLLVVKGNPEYQNEALQSIYKTVGEVIFYAEYPTLRASLLKLTVELKRLSRGPVTFGVAERLRVARQWKQVYALMHMELGMVSPSELEDITFNV